MVPRINSGILIINESIVNIRIHILLYEESFFTFLLDVVHLETKQKQSSNKNMLTNVKYIFILTAYECRQNVDNRTKIFGACASTARKVSWKYVRSGKTTVKKRVMKSTTFRLNKSTNSLCKCPSDFLHSYATLIERASFGGMKHCLGLIKGHSRTKLRNCGCTVCDYNKIVPSILHFTKLTAG